MAWTLMNIKKYIKCGNEVFINMHIKLPFKGCVLGEIDCYISVYNDLIISFFIQELELFKSQN